MKPLFELMCDYNRWMNERLLQACSQLSDEQRREDRGAWFGSLHTTWNHLLVADRLWLGRFTGQPFEVRALDEEIVTDWNHFPLERERTDLDIANWLNSLDEVQLQAPLSFRSFSNPQDYTLPLWVCVTHLFNHQTHHRGQITAMMNGLGVDSGVTDLPYSPLAQVLASTCSDEKSAQTHSAPPL